MITAKTRLLGVIGHPIAHSQSPKMHNASFAANGLDYAYLALDVAPEDLRKAVAGLVALGFEGFNVTMPHKEKIIPLLDTLDETAEISGAVNTVEIRDGTLRGVNTDGSGFMEACAEAGVDFEDKRVLLLGAGGAGAAVAAAVLENGARELIIANRTVSRARSLKAKLESSLEKPAVGGSISVRPLEDLTGLVAASEAIVNTTYLGMKQGDPSPVPLAELHPDKAVCDVVYRREGETELLNRARGVGARVVSGGRMLLYQGVQAQRIWTGEEPNVEAMSDAIGG
ncbi:MAG: shikimate dehydrogenase [Rubrobacteraceae bacterium]